MGYFFKDAFKCSLFFFFLIGSHYREHKCLSYGVKISIGDAKEVFFLQNILSHVHSNTVPLTNWCQIPKIPTSQFCSCPRYFGKDLDVC